MPLLLGRGAWRPVLAVLAWSVMAVPADGQEAASRWRRIAHGDVEVIGNAGHTSVRTVASQMAVVRDALSALAPATARMSVPVRSSSTVMQRTARPSSSGPGGFMSSDDAGR